MKVPNQVTTSLARAEVKEAVAESGELANAMIEKSSLKAITRLSEIAEGCHGAKIQDQIRACKIILEQARGKPSQSTTATNTHIGKMDSNSINSYIIQHVLADASVRHDLMAAIATQSGFGLPSGDVVDAQLVEAVRNG